MLFYLAHTSIQLVQNKFNPVHAHNRSSGRWWGLMNIDGGEQMREPTIFKACINILTYAEYSQHRFLFLTVRTNVKQQRDFDKESFKLHLGGKKRTKYELLDCEFPYLSKCLDNPRNEAYPSASVQSEAGINRSPLNIKAWKWLLLYKPCILLSFLRSSGSNKGLGFPIRPFCHLVHDGVLSQMFGPSCQVYYKDADVSWKWQKDQRDCAWCAGTSLNSAKSDLSKLNKTRSQCFAKYCCGIMEFHGSKL